MILSMDFCQVVFAKGGGQKTSRLSIVIHACYVFCYVLHVSSVACYVFVHVSCYVSSLAQLSSGWLSPAVFVKCHTMSAVGARAKGGARTKAMEASAMESSDEGFYQDAENQKKYPILPVPPPS